MNECANVEFQGQVSHGGSGKYGGKYVKTK